MTNEIAVIEVESEVYAGAPINRAVVVEFGETLMGIHPAAKEVGEVAMRSVAQLALVTGANPLPGTNGIHVWRDKKGVHIQFGVGFWRTQAELEGGMLWSEHPRPMTDDERDYYGIMQGQTASICRGCLTKHAVNLMREMASLDAPLTLTEAKDNVGRIGTAIVNAQEYDKAGRSKQWTADLRSERDLLRQLVPVMQRARQNAIEGKFVKGGEDWSRGEFVRTQTERTQIAAGYSAEDATDDLLDYSGEKRESKPDPLIIEETPVITAEIEGKFDSLDKMIAEAEIEELAKELDAEIVEEAEDNLPWEGDDKFAEKPERLTDGETVISETPPIDFWKAVIALIDRYENVYAAQNAAKKLGITSIPSRKSKNHPDPATERIGIYRALRDHAIEMDETEEK